MGGKAKLGVRVTVVTAVLLTVLGWCTGDPDQPAATGSAGTATSVPPSHSLSSPSLASSSPTSTFASTGTRSQTGIDVGDGRDDAVDVVARPFAAMHGRSGRVHDHSPSPSSARPVVPLTHEPTDDAPPLSYASPQPTISTAPPAVPQQASVPPAPAPAPPAPAAPAPAPTSYANCDAVRAAGQAPLLVGEPGYSSKLDGDSDGIACEVR